jgi:hypothetical protein
MSILQSYRWRRRLIITTIVVAVASPLIFLGVYYSHPANPGNANGPTVPDYVQPTAAPFTSAKKREVRSVLRSSSGRRSSATTSPTRGTSRGPRSRRE